MKNVEVIETLKILPSDRSFKEFYISKAAVKEIELFEYLERKGLIIIQPQSDHIFVNIALTELGSEIISNEPGKSISSYFDSLID
jgi:hypothetical protein